MKILKAMSLLIICLCLAGSPWAAAPADAAADPNREALKALLEDLHKTIDDGEKRMVAHPKFIEELRALADRYMKTLRAVFLDEDFDDGDYTKNPAWVVKAGRFRLTPEKRLWNRVEAEQPAAASSSEEKQEPLGLLLKEIMRSREKKKKKKKETPTKAAAASKIRTMARIAPAFEADITFVSDSMWGAMEVVLLGGKSAVPRYRLVYKPSPSPERPIEIVRVRGSRSYTIESATQYPALDDGNPHRLQWIRDASGRMSVLVDGKEVLSTVELFYQDEFSGLALVNRGGTYEWGPIRVLQAPEE
jgi:hypothetical protein